MTVLPLPEAHADVCALLGDVVHSRDAADRVQLHRQLVEVLDQVDGLVPALDPLRVTVGDEFQGVYRDAGDAVLASLLVRLFLPEGLDVRCGLGRGRVEVVDADRTPPLQDGPAWWAAREAIVEAERRAASPSSRACRTWYCDGRPEPDPAQAGAIRAVLVMRDEVLSALDDRPRRVLLALMSGQTQVTVAQQEGISQSAVSQLVSRGGLAAVREAHGLLRSTSV